MYLAFNGSVQDNTEEEDPETVVERRRCVSPNNLDRLITYVLQTICPANRDSDTLVAVGSIRVEL